MKKKDEKSGVVLPFLRYSKDRATARENARKMMKSILTEMEDLVGKTREVAFKLDGRDVTVELEEAICMVLEEVSSKEEISIDELCARIVLSESHGSSPQSILRAYALEYLRFTVTGERRVKRVPYKH